MCTNVSQTASSTHSSIKRRRSSNPRKREAEEECLARLEHNVEELSRVAASLISPIEEEEEEFKPIEEEEFEAEPIEEDLKLPI